MLKCRKVTSNLTVRYGFTLFLNLLIPNSFFIRHSLRPHSTSSPIHRKGHHFGDAACPRGNHYQTVEAQGNAGRGR